METTTYRVLTLGQYHAEPDWGVSPMIAGHVVGH
jgi:hypothetical protein